jgi:CRP/FNR family transcriptional regulator
MAADKAKSEKALLRYGLSRCRMFSDIPEHVLSTICKAAKFVRAGRKEVIFTEGEVAAGFYVVLSGQVKLFKTGPDGRMQVLHILGAPASFAEAVLSLPVYPATAQATRKTQLAFIRKDAFIKLVQSNRRMSVSIIASLARWLRILSDKVETLTLRTVAGRLAGYILALDSGQRRKPTSTITLPLSKTALAGLLGTTKETLSRTLADLSHSGILRVKGSEIVIADRKGLERAAKESP